MATERRELLPQHPGGNAFQAVDERGDTHAGRICHKEMHVVPGTGAFGKNGVEVGANPGENLPQGSEVLPAKAGAPAFGYKDQVNVHPEYAMPASAITS
jgi:hypothetical protein